MNISGTTHLWYSGYSAEYQWVLIHRGRSPFNGNFQHRIGKEVYQSFFRTFVASSGSALDGPKTTINILNSLP